MTRLPRAWFLVYLVYAALTVWWMVTYSGPARYLNELQQVRFGEYWPKLTVLLLNLPVLAFLYVAAARRKSLASRPDSFPELPWYPLLVLCAGLGIGSWLLWKGVAAGALSLVEAASLNASPPSRVAVYAELSGFPSRNAVSLQSGSAIPVVYIPVYERPGAEEASVVIEVQENEADQRLRAGSDGKTTARGVLESGPSREVRYHFEKAGVRLSENSWVLHTRRDPSKDKSWGVGIMLGGLVWSAVAYWRWRKTRFDKVRNAEPGSV